MKIFVTGGTGFLGRHIVWNLCLQGHIVVFSGRNGKAAEEVLQLAKSAARYVVLSHGEPGASDILALHSRDCDVMIHTAGLSSPWGNREDFNKANIESTQEVLEACKRNGIHHVVYISTPSLYFNFRDSLNIRENDPLPQPVNDYALTKREAENLILSSDIKHAIILRPRALYGPWDNTLLPRLLAVLKKGPVPLPRHGEALLDMTYIDNAVDAVLLAVRAKSGIDRAVYNVSNNDPIRMRDLLTAVSQEFSMPLQVRSVPYSMLDIIARGMEIQSRLSHNQHEPLLTRYGAGVLAFSQTLDITAIRNDLGYSPKIKTMDGIRRHGAWWKAQNG